MLEYIRQNCFEKLLRIKKDGAKAVLFSEQWIVVFFSIEKCKRI